MPVLNNAAEVATELEKVRANGKLPELFQLDDTLFNLIKARTSVDVVSSRPERPVFKVGIGVKSRTPYLDGGDLGRGGGPQYAYGALAQVYKSWIIEWTKLSEAATRTRQQSVVDVAKDILKDHMRAANFNMDSLISYGDGADTLCIVTANAGGTVYDSTNFIIYVDNAARVSIGQDVDYYNGGPGTAITGTFTIKGMVIGANAIYATAALGTAPVAGAYIINNNSTGVANSGINGVLNLTSPATTGTFMGVNRTLYPGQFNTPSVNAGGATLTPQIARLLLTQMKYSAGIDTSANASDYIYFMGPAQRVAWENSGMNITQITQTSANAVAHDQLATKQVDTIGGIPIRESLKAIPGSIFLLNLSSFYRTEIQPMDMYSAGGTETFWPMGASGGIAASFLKYLIWGGNIGCDNPLKNASITNLATPTGYTV